MEILREKSFLFLLFTLAQNEKKNQFQTFFFFKFHSNNFQYDNYFLPQTFSPNKVPLSFKIKTNYIKILIKT